MYPHRIRLRGPWECEPLGPDAPEPHRVLMPCRWADAGLTGFRGSVRFVRKFGYPGKADPELEHIWLTCDGCTGCREVRVNGQQLAPPVNDSFSYDVSSLLTARNQLEVVVQGDTDDAGLWGDVALEMRRDAFLKDVHVNRSGDVGSVAGNVVGTAPRPLELYTLVDHHHVDYRTIEPNVIGTPFHIELANLPSVDATLRIELIHISEIWYIVELPISRWKSD